MSEIINDEVYGKIEINEPILLELINSKEIQRLKNISQFGIPSEYYHMPSYSRYEHSMGVFLLLRKLNVDLKEQIAGLIHDISHTAFSHVIDWVIGDSTQESFQDSVFSEFLEHSHIPQILEKYNLNYKDFLNLEKFTLLEQPIPSLCADRFDYAIREIKKFETPEQITSILDSLKNKNNRLCFVSQEAAEIFAKGYLRCQNQHWAGDQAKARYYILSSILKKALKEKIICFEDIKTTDNEVINILKNSRNKEIIEGLNLLRNGFDIKETEEDNGIILNKKFRYIDPEISIGNNIKRLSEISKEYDVILEQEKQNLSQIKRISIISKF